MKTYSLLSESKVYVIMARYCEINCVDVAAILYMDSVMLMLIGNDITRAMLCFPLAFYSLKTYSVPPNSKLYVILWRNCERNCVTVTAI